MRFRLCRRALKHRTPGLNEQYRQWTKTWTAKFAHNWAAGGHRSCYEKGAQNTCKKELTEALNNLQTCQNPVVNKTAAVKYWSYFMIIQYFHSPKHRDQSDSTSDTTAVSPNVYFLFHTRRLLLNGEYFILREDLYNSNIITTSSRKLKHIWRKLKS